MKPKPAALLAEGDVEVAIWKREGKYDITIHHKDRPGPMCFCDYVSLEELEDLAELLTRAAEQIRRLDKR